MNTQNITVLLVDDQETIGERMRHLLGREGNISFHYCSDSHKALAMACEIKPTVILQDLFMPGIDGMTLITHYRSNPSTCNIPLIVLSNEEDPSTKAEAFAIGANDYLVKLPARVELIARIRYHSAAYTNLLQRNEAYAALEASRKELTDELAKAAKYVRSMLPAILDGEVKTDWRFIPSMQLGGDSFNYHWIDDDHLALYLLDVSGHGIDAALLSISVLNILRAQTLPGTDFCHPAQVLRELNAAFQMEHHNEMFFSIWYGVYNRCTGELVSSSGGHPPAILLAGKDPGTMTIHKITSRNTLIGLDRDAEFHEVSFFIEDYARLYLYSDGVVEIQKPSGTYRTIDEFIEVLMQAAPPGLAVLDHVLAATRSLKGSNDFDDDLSLLEVQFCKPGREVNLHESE